jgi:hypothetical protein
MCIYAIIMLWNMFMLMFSKIYILMAKYVPAWNGINRVTFLQETSVKRILQKDNYFLEKQTVNSHMPDRKSEVN